MAEYILTVTLNPAVDKTVSVPVFSAGSDMMTTVSWQIAGGKGINVARTLKYLGHKVIAAGFLGGNTGCWIEASLKAENIPASFLPIAGLTRVHTTISDCSSGRIARLLERGPRISAGEYKSFRLCYEKLLRRACGVVISGSLPLGLKAESYRELVEMARRRGIICALDTYGEPLRHGLRAKPDLIKPNFDELAGLLRENNRFIVGKKTFERLARYGIRYALVTLGDKGAWISDFKKVLRVKHKSVRGRNYVGCGDAFLAGFISGLLRHKSLGACAHLAAACGIANLYAPHTGALTRSAVKRAQGLIRIEDAV